LQTEAEGLRVRKSARWRDRSAEHQRRCIRGSRRNCLARGRAGSKPARGEKWDRRPWRHRRRQLTSDRGAYEAIFRRLARMNLTDLDPPRLLYLLLFTFPTTPERRGRGV